MKHSNIFFPIETIDRELDAKLLLASLLSNEIGYVIFAQHDLVIKLIKLSLNGVYFGKNIMNPNKIQMYMLAKEKGFIVAHLDEEGVYQGMQPEIESILDTRLDVTTMQSDDYVFTWGKFQEDHYKSKCNDLNQPIITTTGHIRFDLFKKQFRNYHEDKAKIYREKYGPYILITTTFGFALSPYGYDDTFSKRNGYGVSQFKSSKLVKEWSVQLHQLSHLIELIHEISPKFPEYKIVVRPHVAEDMAFYCAALNGLDNVKILKEGTSAPWIAGSDLLIHNGSTVGLEAYFRQKPIIHYEYISNEETDSLIVKKIGSTCKNPQEVIRAINDVLKGKKLDNSEEFDEFDHRVLDQLKNDDYMKLPKLLEELIMDKSSKGISKTVPIIRLFLIEYLYQILNFIKKPIRKLFFPKLQRMYLADQTSFPGFKKTDLLSRLNKIEKLTGKKFKIKFISKRIFFIKGITGKD
jgi:surface carbohydrate biosynthesis protein